MISAPDQGKAIFGLIASNVTCYLLNLFSTNNNIPSNHLGLLPVPDVGAFDVRRLSSIVDNLLASRSALSITYAPLGGRFLDADGVLSVSPEAVLANSRLPSVTLANLAMRGDISFAGTNSARLGNVVPRYLTVAADGPLAQVVSIFLQAHPRDRWGDVANNLQLPEPSVAAAWLTTFETTQASLTRDWSAFEVLQRDLDDAICDWYQFAEAYRTAIADGLPWTRA